MLRTRTRTPRIPTAGPPLHLMKNEHGGWGVPIANAGSMRSFSERPVDAFVVRKEKKDHGTAKKIDGNFRDNSNVVLFEDVTTRGGSEMREVRAGRLCEAT